MGYFFEIAEDTIVMAECGKLAYRENPSCGGRYIEFRKMSILQNRMKISAPNFVQNMHRGHTEMIT